MEIRSKMKNHITEKNSEKKSRERKNKKKYLFEMSPGNDLFEKFLLFFFAVWPRIFFFSKSLTNLKVAEICCITIQLHSTKKLEKEIEERKFGEKNQKK